MKPLRICRVCGFEALTLDDLEHFTKDKRLPYGRERCCKQCKNKYNAKWKKENNYSVIDVDRQQFLKNSKKPLICYFCDKSINKLDGKTKTSLAIHSLDGDHENWDFENKVPAHYACHSSYHTSIRKKSKLSLKTKQKISKALTGRKLTKEHKRSISLSLRGKKHYNWKGDKAKSESIRHREWVERKRRENQT